MIKDIVKTQLSITYGTDDRVFITLTGNRSWLAINNTDRQHEFMVPGQIVKHDFRWDTSDRDCLIFRLVSDFPCR